MCTTYQGKKLKLIDFLTNKKKYVSKFSELCSSNTTLLGFLARECKYKYPVCSLTAVERQISKGEVKSQFGIWKIRILDIRQTEESTQTLSDSNRIH